jgi:hypothetical protein
MMECWQMLLVPKWLAHHAPTTITLKVVDSKVTSHKQ